MTFTWSDVWILVSIDVATWRDGSADLKSIIEEADGINHAIPRYEEFAYGLQRLVEGGFVTADGLTFMPTPAARAMLERAGGIHAGGLDAIDRIRAELGATDWTDPDVDQGDAPFPGLTKTDVDVAYQAYHAESEPIVRAIVAAAQPCLRRMARSRRRRDQAP